MRMFQVLVLFLVGGLVFGQSLEDRLREASKLPGGLRLEAYDRILQEAGIMDKPVAMPVVPQVRSAWRSNQSTDPINEMKTISIRQTKQVMIDGSRQDVTLFITRNSIYPRSDLHLSINWGSYLGERPAVTYRINDWNPVSSTWIRSGNNTSTIFPDSSMIIRFVTTLMEVEKVVFRTKPYSDSTITVEFPMAGLREEIEKFPDFLKVTF